MTDNGITLAEGIYELAKAYRENFAIEVPGLREKIERDLELKRQAKRREELKTLERLDKIVITGQISLIVVLTLAMVNASLMGNYMDAQIAFLSLMLCFFPSIFWSK